MGWLQRLIGKDGTNPATTANGVPVHTGTSAEAGFVTIQSRIDEGTITGTALNRSPYVTEEGGVETSEPTTLALYNFTATTQNTGKFKHAFTTMTMTQSSGFLNINPASATVSGNYAYLQSWRHFPLQGDGALEVEIIGQINNMPPANQILETGLYLGTAGTAPADGVFFRLTSSGLYGIMTYNGVETPTSLITATIPSNTNGKYTIRINQRVVSFWIDGVLGATLTIPAANAVPFLTLSLPMCLMMRNTGTVTGGMITKIGSAHLTQHDQSRSQPFAFQQANQGSAYQGQDGDTQGQLSNWANLASPAATVLTNTTANITGLGGVAQVTVTLAAATDGIIFNYTNPAGSVTQPPKTLVITGVTIDAMISVVLPATALTQAIAIAYGHTAVSLATAETGSFVTATTKAPRRIPIGTLSFLASAAVGTASESKSIVFQSPIVVNPGENVAIIAKTITAAPATGAYVMTCNFDHYFE